MENITIQIILAILVAMLGASFGSFLSMLIPRLHKKIPGIVLGKSHCPDCKEHLKIKDLIPVFSYIGLKGECRYCNKRIHHFYFVLEVVTAAVFLLLFWKFNFINPEAAASGELINYEIFGQFWVYIFYALVLIFTFFYDYVYMVVSDLVLLPAIGAGLVLTILPFTPTITSTLLGAAILFAFFFLQILITKGKGLGGGDLRIGLFMGVILGWQLGLVAIVISYLIGSVVSIFLLLTKKAKMKTKIPLGTFLSLGTLITIVFGQNILDWYLNLPL